MTRCARCHHASPNPEGCASCNPVRLGERLRDALARVARLEDILGIAGPGSSPRVIWAAAAKLGGMFERMVPVTQTLDGSTLVAVNLPTNCTYHSADHLGIGTADLQAIITLAMEIGRVWRDQEGISGALLDELAMVTAKGEPGAIAHSVPTSKPGAFFRVAETIHKLPDVNPGDRVLWIGREWTVASTNADPNRGHFAIEFAERDVLDDVALRVEAEETQSMPAGGWFGLQPNSIPKLPSMIPKMRELFDQQWAPMDEAIALAMSLGYTPSDMMINRQPVPDLGERTSLVIAAVGDDKHVEVFEVVTTWPSLPMSREDALLITVNARWLRDIEKKKENADG